MTVKEYANKNNGSQELRNERDRSLTKVIVAVVLVAIVVSVGLTILVTMIK